MRLFALTVIALAAQGCMVAHTSTSNYPGKLTEKPANCGARVLRFQPQQQFDEVGSVLLEGSIFVTPADAEAELVERACKSGADAAVVTYERYGVPFVGTQVQAVFVKLREASAQPEAVPVFSL